MPCLAIPAAVAPELARLYARVFAEPPYREGPEQVQEFLTYYTEDSAKPGFAVVTAREDGTLVGFTYGTARAPGKWWPGCDKPPPPAIMDGPSFAVYEWAVDKRYRGRGIGRELMTRILAHRPEQWATLTVNPAADAYRIYLRAGWRRVSMSYRDNTPPMVVLIRQIAGWSAIPWGVARGRGDR
jgi:ribosomal protein S18 acetylase RimI-like enzyme